MPSLEKVLLAIGERNLKVTVESDDTELIEIKSENKNIDLVIKDNEKFKELLKGLRR
ncbi:hypothetical protein KKA03_03440 [archaeon]|nr:hypothetical protein [archaeon]